MNATEQNDKAVVSDVARKDIRSALSGSALGLSEPSSLCKQQCPTWLNLGATVWYLSYIATSPGGFDRNVIHLMYSMYIWLHVQKHIHPKDHSGAVELRRVAQHTAPKQSQAGKHTNRTPSPLPTKTIASSNHRML